VATIALDIHGQGVAIQSYQNKVHQLDDVIVRHLARFRRIALRFLGNMADAEDAVQDTFLSAFTRLDQFGGQAKMSTWLTAIVINAARMKLRQRRPQAQISLDETHGEQNLLLAEILPDHQPNPEEVCCRRELAERIADATTQLSPTLRKTFQVRDIRLEHPRNRASPRSAKRHREGSARKGSRKTKGNSEKEPRGNGDVIRSTRADNNPHKKRLKRSYGASSD